MVALLLLSQVGCGRVDIWAEDSSLASDKLASAALAAPSAELHDLAVTAIDFDPALRPGSFAATDNINLLVAVENRGNQAESDAVVEATLYGLPDSDVLVTSKATIMEIVPGESQVVRFSNFSSIPLRSAYYLRVETRSVQGEIVLGNNAKSYRLEVTVSSH